jgi:hypothetical protein
VERDSAQFAPFDMALASRLSSSQQGQAGRRPSAEKARVHGERIILLFTTALEHILISGPLHAGREGAGAERTGG